MIDTYTKIILTVIAAAMIARPQRFLTLFTKAAVAQAIPAISDTAFWISLVAKHPMTLAG